LFGISVPSTVAQMIGCLDELFQASQEWLQNFAALTRQDSEASVIQMLLKLGGQNYSVVFYHLKNSMKHVEITL